MAEDSPAGGNRALILPETRVIHSVESLLTPPETAELLSLVSAALDGRRAEFAVGTRSRSVHEIRGASVATIAQTYEPSGRIEFDELGPEVTDILNLAVSRRLDDIRVAFPSVRRAKGWFYVEYGEGQFVTPHVDYPVDDDVPGEVKYAAIGVVLAAPSAGGEFFVETAGSAANWVGGMLRPGADLHSPWFRDLPRTRWLATPRAGDALCWGTQVVHGSQPVRHGVAAKMIALLH